MARTLFMNYSEFFKKFFIILFSLLMLFLFVEINLRIFAGFLKEGEITAITGNDTFNIICLGDSFTYGVGVDRTDSYPNQLEKILNQKESGLRFRVINLAVPGANSSQHLKYLKQILKGSCGEAVDLIIVLTGANDSWNLADSNISKIIERKRNRDNNGRNGGAEEYTEEIIGKGTINYRLSLADKINIFLFKLRTYKMLKLIYLNIKGRNISPEADRFEQIPAYEGRDVRVLKDLLRYNLSRIVETAKKYGKHIILHNYPRGDLYGDNITEEVAEHYKIPFVDNASVFNSLLKDKSFSDLFIYDNSHPNSYGYKIMAGNLYTIIRKVIRVK
ncbi:MAG: hypothetical protein GF375_02515 [Candidatus Omnitrophica bacterium]|nr:hypothetical protein [Candidatus Omnitrophota bacterium]MBD3268974.1 hypothetical protein [Candidatus Omnitrophota bacterium]